MPSLDRPAFAQTEPLRSARVVQNVHYKSDFCLADPAKFNQPDGPGTATINQDVMASSSRKKSRKSRKRKRSSGNPLEQPRTIALLLLSAGILLLALGFVLVGLMPQGASVSLPFGMLWMMISVGLLATLAWLGMIHKSLPSGALESLAMVGFGLQAWAITHAWQSMLGRLESPLMDVLAVALICAGLGVGIQRLPRQTVDVGDPEDSEADPITGLLTRNALIERHETLKRGASNSLVMLSLNDLEFVQDNHGLSSGDARLKALADAIRHALPPGAMAGRWSASEFVISLPGRHERLALDLGYRMREALPIARANWVPLSVGAADALGGKPLERPIAAALTDLHTDRIKHRPEEVPPTGIPVKVPHTFEEFVLRLQRLSTIREIVYQGLGMALNMTGFDAIIYAARETDGVYVLKALEGQVDPGLKGLIGRAQYKPGKGLIGEVIASGKMRFEADYTDNAKARDEEPRGVKSIVLAPVLDDDQVVAVVGLVSFRHWQPITEMGRTLVQAVANRLAEPFKEGRALSKERNTLRNSLLVIGRSLEVRNLETAGHTERVVNYATKLGMALEVTGRDLFALIQGAYLHDIGKMGVPDRVLLKEGKLDDEEWIIMKTHTTIGFDAVKGIPAIEQGARDVIRHHHERLDGKGYPDGLSGSKIPLGARIFAVCDVFDALTSERPYKKAWTEEEAIKEIKRGIGTQFDKGVVDVFVDRVLDKVSINSFETQIVVPAD
jgi:HD-GYP domain-containing protein (c-di-GMP phosphodiesterase class II)/GGDEF domain-containing protein